MNEEPKLQNLKKSKEQAYDDKKRLFTSLSARVLKPLQLPRHKHPS